MTGEKYWMKSWCQFIRIALLYREDLVEISGHGSPYVLQQIIDACIKMEPGWQSRRDLPSELF
jgi:hypothetical protein